MDLKQNDLASVSGLFILYFVIIQGINLINALIDEYSFPVVQAYMEYIQVQKLHLLVLTVKS